jgi:hypothetical protein
MLDHLVRNGLEELPDWQALVVERSTPGSVAAIVPG